VFSGLPETMGRLWATTGDPSSNAMGVTWAGIIMGLGFVLSFGYWTTDFLVVQRAFSSKDLRSAQLRRVVIFTTQQDYRDSAGLARVDRGFKAKSRVKAAG